MQTEEKRDIKSMLPEELEEYCKSINQTKYRAGQVFRRLHSGVKSFDEMTELSRVLREELNKEFYITVPLIAEKQVSKKDGTIKYLWQTSDNNTLESVVMNYEHGNTVCISTQIGCRMSCLFCASAIGGLIRNLSASEMIDQVLFAQIDSGLKIKNIVLMGIGEPLDNFGNVLRFLTLVNHPLGLNTGMRNITLSTCGLSENIDKLAEYNIKLNVAVSLHAADDETRSMLMPVNKSQGVDKLLETCDRYFHVTGRRITYEYALIDGINDTVFHAQTLSRKLKNKNSHINLILLNNVPETSFRASANESVKEFTKILGQNGINYTIRRKLGNDIEASCGQLRRRSNNALS